MSWKDALPEAMRDNKAFEGIDSVENLANQHINHLQYQGNSIRLPDEGASPEAMTDFYGKMIDKVPGLIVKPDADNPESMKALAKMMGVPDEVGGYTVPEAMNKFEGINTMLTIAHESGLTQKQFESMMTGMATNVTGQQTDNQESFDKDIRALKVKWGVVYEDNVQLAKNTLKATKAPDELTVMAAEGKLPSSTLQWLHQIGTQLGAEGINSHISDETTRVTPAEAKEQIDAIMGDKEHAYWHPEDSGHSNAVSRVNELAKAAFVE